MVGDEPPIRLAAPTIGRFGFSAGLGRRAWKLPAQVHCWTEGRVAGSGFGRADHINGREEDEVGSAA